MKTILKNYTNKKFLMLALCFASVFCYSTAFSAPDPRFLAMDKNGDKLVSLQEFLDSNPNMNENAFAIIDMDNNKQVTFEEWTIFQQKHSMPDGLKVDTDKISNLPAKKAPDAPTSPTNPKAPTMPPMSQMGSDMPLMPPMKSMFDSNPNEVKEVRVPTLIQKENSLPLLGIPTAPTAPNVSTPDKQAPSENSLMPLLLPK